MVKNPPLRAMYSNQVPDFSLELALKNGTNFIMSLFFILIIENWFKLLIGRGHGLSRLILIIH